MSAELRRDKKVRNKLDALDRLRPKVALGFFLFWMLYAAAWVGVGVVYWPF